MATNVTSTTKQWWVYLVFHQMHLRYSLDLRASVIMSSIIIIDDFGRKCPNEIGKNRHDLYRFEYKKVFVNANASWRFEKRRKTYI